MHWQRGGWGWLSACLAFTLVLVIPPLPAAVHGASPPAETSTAGTLTLKPVVGYSVKNDLSPDIGSLVGREQQAADPVIVDIPLGRPPKPGNVSSSSSLAPTASLATETQPLAPRTDSVLQSQPALLSAPPALADFAGIGYTGSLPADANGAAGPNHYVQTVNRSYAVWDKSGTALLGPLTIQTIWQGFGDACEFYGHGDPIVKYDRQADRWLISQLAFLSGAPFYECIAVSQTPSPTGSWYRYAFQTPGNRLGDYPKFGIWPDGYYMSVNEFDGVDSASAFVGVGFFAFDRSAMLKGNQAAVQYFDSSVPGASSLANYYGVLPADLDGPTLPPAGAPEVFATTGNGGTGDSGIYIWRFHVDWTNPSATTLTGPTYIAVATFDLNLCNYENCIPQPGTSQKLDAISAMLMYRLVYRNFGDYQSVVASHTVDVDGLDHAGVRWYEFRATTGSYSLYQQGTYAPDADHRWMGSIAMDRNGNIALGYSVSGPSLYPSIRYAGRLVSDPLGTLSAEQTLMAGAGSQTSTLGRWGDYSSMDVDPSDDCTFWYTSEYYSATSERTWSTRVSAFRFPGCVGMKLTAPAVAATGVPQSIIVAALDNTGKPVESYRGTVHFTSTDSSATLPADYTFTDADRGAHTFSSAFTFRTRGAQQVSAIDTAFTRVLDSSAVSVTTVPGAPTSVTVSATGNGQVSLSWTAPADSGGSAITGYSMTATPSGGAAITKDTGSADAGYTFTGLTNATAYVFTVKAVNSAGAGVASAASSSVTLRPSACRYDANRSGATERAEALQAITDYLFARTTIVRSEAIEVLSAFLLQQTFTCK